MTRGELEAQAARQRGRKIEPIHVDPEALYLWQHYWQLRRGQSISYSELVAYQRTTGWNFAVWEIDVLLRIDAAVDAQIAEEMQQ